MLTQTQMLAVNAYMLVRTTTEAGGIPDTLITQMCAARRRVRPTARRDPSDTAGRLHCNTRTAPRNPTGLPLQVGPTGAENLRWLCKRNATRSDASRDGIRRLAPVGGRHASARPHPQPKPPPSDPTPPEEAVAELGAAVERALKVRAETRALIDRARMFPARPTVTRPMPRVRAVCSRARIAPRPRAARPRAMSRASSRSGDSGDDSSREPDLPALARLGRALRRSLIARWLARVIDHHGGD